MIPLFGSGQTGNFIDSNIPGIGGDIHVENIPINSNISSSLNITHAVMRGTAWLNFLSSENPIFRNDLSEKDNSYILGDSRYSRIDSEISILSGNSFSGSFLHEYLPINKGEFESTVSATSNLLNSLNAITGDFYSGNNIELITKSIDGKLISNVNISGYINSISEYFRGTLKSNVSSISSIYSNIPIVTGNINAQYYYGENEIYSRSNIIRGNIEATISILSSIEYCNGIPVINGSMEEIIKFCFIDEKFPIIDRCSIIEILNDVEKILKNIRGEVR